MGRANKTTLNRPMSNDEIKQLHAEGVSFAEIGRKNGISRQAVERIVKAIPKPKQPKIAKTPKRQADFEKATNTDNKTLVFQKLVGDLIRTKRKEKFMEVEQLAKKLGLAPGTIYNMESGHSGFMWQHIINIARALEIATDELIPARGYKVK